MTRSPANRKTRKLTPKGLRTRSALAEAARQVFEERGYFGASVSEIGRRCGLSQGTFYQYFSNKEQAFRELTDDVLSEFWAKANQAVDGAEGFRGQLKRVVRLMLEHARDNSAFHRILNDFELIDIVTIGYYDSLARFCREFFRKAIKSGEIKTLDPNVIAYSLIGIAIFHQMDWGEGQPVITGEELVELSVDLLLQGVGGTAEWQVPANLAVSRLVPGEVSEFHWDEAQTTGEVTRRALFQAAEKVVGRLGYNGASVAEITRRAGVAQGTFYIHFSTKEDLMSGLVRFLSRELRRELRRITDQVEDRRDQEREGMLAFFRFLERHAQIYRVVAESETIGREVALWYYRKLGKGYIEALEPSLEKGQIRNLPVEFMARSLMGINHMIGLRWLVWTSLPNPEISPQVLEDAIELVLFGLSRDS